MKYVGRPFRGAAIGAAKATPYVPNSTQSAFQPNMR